MFSTNELWPLPAISMPAPGVAVPVQLTNVLSGFPVEVRYVAGPGSYTFSNDVLVSSAPWKPGMSGSLTSSSSNTRQGKVITVSYGSANPFVVISRPELSNTHELAVRLREGDRLIGKAESASSANGIAYFSFSSLVPPREYPDAGTAVAIDVILQEGTPFEFLVNPLHHFGYGAPR